LLCRDWKKLTFYYFADSYINFNSLVTDLFKIYKTRIWMSAINPASFVTPPTAGLSGPATMPNPLYGQEADRRHQLESRSYGGARDAVDPGREMSNPVGVLRTSYGEPYQSLSQPPRHPEGPHSDIFAPQVPSSFGPADSFEYSGNIAGSNGSSRMHPAQGEWINRFQGLSLNS
jgi:hypothetical protein